MFEELDFRRREIELKSGSVVEFCLYFFNKERCNIIKVSPFRDILSDKFVCIFNGPLLPGRIGISEKDRDPKFFGDEIMVSKLRAVVGGNGSQKMSVGQEHGHHVFCKFLGILPAVSLLIIR